VIRAICVLLLLAAAGCGEVHGHGTGPALSDLVVPLDGNPVTGAVGELTLDTYVSKYATVPSQERAEFAKAGYVTGFLRSTLDTQYGRRVYLLKFRDAQAAHDVYAWYHSFASTGTFGANLDREHFGRITQYQTPDNRQAFFAQLMFPAGPFVAIASVTVAVGASLDAAQGEAIRIATEESSRLP
jgi:hypothetical protein